MLVTGPSGSGKSTLFRAIAGIWPFGSGRVVVPKDARLMMLPQRPYFPVGSLAAAVTYPAEPAATTASRSAEAINAVGLPALAQRLDEEAHWNRMLSLGEQQRLGIARAILQAPDFLFLDEATASLDEPSEAALYRLLQERLPGCDHRFDRPPLDARGVPSPAACARARRRAAIACTRRRSRLPNNITTSASATYRRLLGPRATTLCQAKANSASSSAPTPTGAIKKAPGQVVDDDHQRIDARPADETCR